MMPIRPITISDKKGICMFAFETWKNVMFTLISSYHLSILSPLMIRQEKTISDILKMNPFSKCNSNGHGLLWLGSVWLQPVGAEL